MTAIRVTACAVLLVLGLYRDGPRSALAQTPGRDAARAVQTGTATVDGIVVSDDTDARPLRRVRVAVMTSDRQVGRTTVTDDGGRFSFAALPAGRYMLSANKQGYVPASYGASRPNRPGTALVLAEAQRITGLTLRMTRGSVISGVIVDQNGEPFSGANVSVMRNVFAGSGQRTLVPVNTVQSDDRGHYRVWGLRDGRVRGVGESGIHLTHARHGDRASDRRRRQAGAVRRCRRRRPPGGAANAPADPGPRARMVGYATVFYPGNLGRLPGDDHQARRRGRADRRRLSLVPDPDGQGRRQHRRARGRECAERDRPDDREQSARHVPRRVPDARGRTPKAPSHSRGWHRGLTPSSRRRSHPPAGPHQPPARRGPTHWARADITLDGQDVAGLALTLQPGMVVAGKIQLLGTSATPPDLTRMRVNLMPIQSPGEVSLGQMQIQPDASGAFSIAGVTPGRYRLMANIPSARPDTVVWQLKSSVINGQDTLDVPVDLREGTDSAVITFTDQVTELNGMVQDAAGQPAPEYHLVLFARDKTLWTAQSRRIRTTRPGADGKYVMPGIPPGEYLMTAVTDIEPGEQFDPAFLELLSRSAIALTIGDGEKKTQDLRLAAQR